MKIHRYQSLYEIVHAVCNDEDVEQLRTSMTMDTDCNLEACKEALRIYDEQICRLWSTPYLKFKVEEGKDRFIWIYQQELQNR